MHKITMIDVKKMEPKKKQELMTLLEAIEREIKRKRMEILGK